MSKYFHSNLLFLRKQKGLSQTDVAFQVKKGHTTIGNWEKGTTEPSLSELSTLSQFFDVSIDKLISADLTNVHLNGNDASGKKVHLNVHGHVHLNERNAAKELTVIEKAEADVPALRKGSKASGPMPRIVTMDSQGNENAVFVPVKARAGYLQGYGDPQFIEKLPAYRLPGMSNGTFRIFEVDGVSMFNTLQDKDRVIGRWSPVSEIRDERVYVLVTKNDGVLIKRTLNRLEEGKLICKSDNNHKGEYPHIVIDIHDVLEAWYVVERWTRQLPSPGEIYKRIIDLEADMTLIKHMLKKGEA